MNEESSSGALVRRLQQGPLLGGQGPFGSYVAGLPDKRRAIVRAAVRDAYLSGGPDGPRSLAATAWAVRGRVP